ncbi:MAG: phosphoribosyltransferase family protein [Candidatus Micrarchaeota archaeon]
MFKDRCEAGKLLSCKLEHFRGRKDCLILGIPRGGAIIASEISKSLDLPFSLLVVRKLCAPNNPELAIGAVGMDGMPYLDESIVKSVGASAEYIGSECEKQYSEVKRRMKEFRIGKTILANKTIILVDDGIATGATVIAAIQILRSQKVNRIVLAVPVCSIDTSIEMKRLVDFFICLNLPESFSAVGQFYSDFRQVSDQEVKELLLKGK